MDSLRAVVEYMREAEQKHYEESEGVGRELHIWNAVLELERYLDGDQNEECGVCEGKNPEGCTYC